MVTAQVEPWNGGTPELRALVPEHYEDLSLHREKGFPLAPQWHAYAKRDAEGGLLFVTLRRDGRLVGYVIVFLSPGLHYASCFTAMTDIFFIAESERGGVGALKLFRCAEKEICRRGADLWVVGYKRHRPEAGRMLKALGFAEADVLCHKWLGG